MDNIDIADRIEAVNYWTGLCLNLLLVLLILFVTKPEIGVYKYLQLIFVLNDIAYASYSFIMHEKFINQGHTFAMFLTSSYGNNLHLVCVNASIFSLILVTLAFNFLYRYWAVVSPHRLRLFSTAWFPLMLVAFNIAEFAVWYALCFYLFAATDDARADLMPAIEEKYGVDAMSHAMVVGDYWRGGHYNAGPLIGLAAFVAIINGGFGFMIYCTVSIIGYLSIARAISPKTRRLQYALFRSLAVQTLFPLVFVHADAGHMLILPVFGHSLGVLSDWCSTIISFFPPLDAIATILLMRDYRETVGAVLCRTSKTTSKVESTVAFSERGG